MIVCRDCGFRNEDGDEWCAECGSFLEFKGEAVAAKEKIAVAVEEPASGPGRFEKVREMLSVDDDSLDRDVDEHARVAAEDAALAAKVVADRERAEAAAAAQAAEAEAARRLDEVRQQEAAAAEAAARAAEELDELRRAQAEEAARERAAAEAAAAEAARRHAERLKAAEDEARRQAEAAARQRAEELAAQERAAEEARAAAEAEAERARQAELAAERDRAEAQRRVEVASAAAAAAALRAAEERDAISAAQAAKELSEAQAEQSRAEAAAATAAAAEEIAKARAEAEAARLEAAALRAQAQADASRSSRERDAERAEQIAADEAAAARRRVEEQEAADARRRESEAEAARVKAAAGAEAAQRRAEAELEAKEHEARAAAARAEAEKARAEKEAAERERDRQRRLQEAARIVAKPEPPGATSAAKPSGGGKAGGATSGGRSGPAATKPGAGGVAAGGAVAARTAEAGGKVGEQAPTEGGPVRPAKSKAPRVDREINPGDLVCGNCGSGNVATRKFCRRCGESLREAKPAKLGFFARLKAKRRLKKQRRAGDRPGRGGRGGSGAGDVRMAGRLGWFKLNTLLLRAGALLGVLAVLGFGVEPIRSRLQLPNVRQKILDQIRGVTNATYDPVRPVRAVANSSAPESDAAALIDLGNNTAWMAAPTPSGGVGSTITVTFDKPFDLGRVLFTSGLQGSTEPGKGYVSQPRPSELRVTFNGDVADPVTVPVKDTEKPQVLKIKHDATTSVTLEVTGVYPASDGVGKSVAVTEIEFFQRRKFGDDFETLPAPKFFVTGTQGASALSDDNLDTAWVSAPAADGVGQGFTIRFDTPTDVDRIRIAPGHGEAEFQISPRPDDVQLAITCQGRCDATKQVSFADKPGYKNVSLKATGVTEIQVLVRSVHGTGGGVAFAEVQVQRKRPKVQ